MALIHLLGHVDMYKVIATATLLGTGHYNIPSLDKLATEIEPINFNYVH